MTYTFHVVVERDAHQWRAYCPAFESYEASTGGQTREEALAHIHSVLFINLEQILAQGAPVPVDVEIPWQPDFSRDLSHRPYFSTCC